MAWYLVQHGTRFHFSHEFKPLLLTQFEAWYKGEIYCQRIRHRSRKKKSRSSGRHTNQSSIDDDSEEETEVWMDSSVNNWSLAEVVGAKKQMRTLIDSESNY